MFSMIFPWFSHVVHDFPMTFPCFPSPHFRRNAVVGLPGRPPARWAVPSCRRSAGRAHGWQGAAPGGAQKNGRGKTYPLYRVCIYDMYILYIYYVSYILEIHREYTCKSIVASVHYTRNMVFDIHVGLPQKSAYFYSYGPWGIGV